MQNLPLLNTPNIAQKNNVHGQPKPAIASAKPADDASFQQKLMRQINNNDKRSAQESGKKPEQATSADEAANAAPEKQVSGTDIALRKAKAQIIKPAESEMPQQANAGEPATPTTEVAAIPADETLDPASLNVLAQLQQATSASQATAQPVDDETPVGNSSKSVQRQDPAVLQQAGEDTETGKNDPRIVATKELPATDIRQESGRKVTPAEEFDSMLSTTLSKGTAAKEPVVAMMQVNPMVQANTAAAVANPSMIQAYPGKEGWNQAIGQKVLWMVGNSQQTATLTLNPPDLGPLQIVVNVHNDKADTTFLSDRQEVRQALQDGMDNLREMMKEAGISLGQTNINERGRSAQDFAQQAQKAAMGESRNDPSSDPESSSAVVTTRAGLGLVDTFA
ncbi:Flagellar hook-length control protein [Methylophilaceae bacterium]|nr:Flagellar hook-length control protein [Methylophilaceae bacterium]